MNPPLSPRLAQRLAKARERRTAPTPPNATPTSSPAIVTPAAPAAAPKPAPSNTRPAPKPAPPAKATSPLDTDGAPLGHVETVAALLRRMARRPDLLATISDADLKAMWAGVVAGSAMRGSQGAADRQTLFRAVGLPFVAGASAAASGTDVVVGDRLERASARLAALRRHSPVTGADDDTPEAAPFLANRGDAHQIDGHMRYPTTHRGIEHDDD